MVREYDPDEVPSVHDLTEVPAIRDEPGFRQVVFRGMDHMIGFSQIGPEKEEGDPHSHSFEQSNMLLDGRLNFLIDGELVELTQYDAVTIPPHVPHTSRVVDGQSATLLAFWPLREDRLEGTAYQQEFPSI